MVGTIIVGAGEGKRMGARGRKQFVKIAGKPLIAYTIEVFERSPAVDHIVVVVPRDSVDWVREEIIEEYGFKKVHAVVYGGETRQQSVHNGLKAVKQGTTMAVIHDAVRPLVSETLIARVLDAAEKTGAAITAVPARDTVKRVESGDIVGTLDRRLLWFAQTPQAFRYSVIIDAHNRAAADKFEATDDAALLEKYGTKVAVAVGSYSNIKITSPEDLPMFEFFLGPEVRAKIDATVRAGAQAGPAPREGKPRGQRRHPRRPASKHGPSGPPHLPLQVGHGERVPHPRPRPPQGMREPLAGPSAPRPFVVPGRERPWRPSQAPGQAPGRAPGPLPGDTTRTGAEPGRFRAIGAGGQPSPTGGPRPGAPAHGQPRADGRPQRDRRHRRRRPRRH